MKKILFAALLFFVPAGAFAQTVTPFPQFAPPRSVVDMGNGPMEIQALIGNGGVFTSYNSGLGSTASSTAVTLNATPASNPPCVGCAITGAGIPANDTIAAYNGTTGITLTTAATATASGVTLSWGSACPVSTQTAYVPLPQNALVLNLNAGSGNLGATALPIYSQARVCVTGEFGPGLQFLTFPIGAH